MISWVFPILLIADLFHPIDNLTIQRFVDGDVGHGSCRSRSIIVRVTDQILESLNQIEVKEPQEKAVDSTRYLA